VLAAMAQNTNSAVFSFCLDFIPQEFSLFFEVLLIPDQFSDPSFQGYDLLFISHVLS
jgi:hypothetical protein